jgi:membrane-bound ClpP family serine protease
MSATHDAAHAAEVESNQSEMDHAHHQEESIVASVATLCVVGVGVAVVEAAMLPAVLLGAAAVVAPKVAPQAFSIFDPLFRSTVRGVYKLSQKTREFMAETHERVNDIVAEVDAQVPPNGSAGVAHSAAAAKPTATPHAA